MRLGSGRKINEKEPESPDNGVCTIFTSMIVLFALLKGTQLLLSNMV